MCAAIATASVGDDQLGEDHTINWLPDCIVSRLRKQAALTNNSCQGDSYAIRLSATHRRFTRLRQAGTLDDATHHEISQKYGIEWLE